MRDRAFDESLNGVEKAAWMSSIEVVTEYFAKRKAGNYSELDSEFFQNYKALECTMPLKIYFPDSLGLLS